MEFWIAFAIIYIVQGIASGVAVNIILDNKGYSEDNWFLWGFFFGIIALIVASSRPEDFESVMDDEEHSKSILKSGGWICSYCNTLNGDCVTSCSCGRSRDESSRHIKELERFKNSGVSGNNDEVIKNENEILELISKYKKLLETGAITQEEFDNKKNSLLNS